MNRIRYIFFSVLLFLIGAGVLSCKKEVADPDSYNPNVLPPLTHEGKNTFGCKVNGEVWVAYVPFTVGGAVAITGEFNLGEGYIRATTKNDEKHQIIGMFFKNISGVGEYYFYLNSETKLGIMYLDDKSPSDCSSIYYHDLNNIGVLNISYLNQNERIMSGTFEMDLINPSCPGDTIRIREGRFDCRY